MSTMSCTIGGSAVSVKDQSFKLDDSIDQRSVLALTVLDPTGTLSFQRGQPVVLSDSVLGTLYAGYVNNDKPNRLGPSSSNTEHAITCMDKHYLADKRTNVINYVNWYAGDIICDFIQRTLGAEGVTGPFAMEADYSPASFNAGTLAGTVGTPTTQPIVGTAPPVAPPPSTTNSGDLEPTLAGSAVSILEATSGDFGSGTLTSMQAVNNALTPTTQSAVCVQAQLPTSLGSLGALATVEIWSGSLVVAANDTLNYDIWIASTSPGFAAAVDLGFSDGSTLSGVTGGVYDQNGYLPGPTSPIMPTPPGGSGNNPAGPVDLSSFTKDTWYTRNVGLASLSGKTINTVSVSISGNAAGAYTVYVKNCYLGSAAGSPFFATNATQTQVNPPVVTNAAGFQSSLIVTTVVQAYNPAISSRISLAHSIDAVKLVRSSTVSWTASLPATTPTGAAPPVLPTGSPASNPTAPQSLLFVSYDGTTWLPCTNQAPLPGLPAGANVAGLSLTLQERFASGPYPTAIPALTKVTISIQSAANATTSDVTAAYGTTSQWNAGTETGTIPNANGDLTVGGTISRNWNDNLITNQTFFPGFGMTSTQSAATGAYVVTPQGATGAAQSRFDFASSAQDFTIECDLTATGTNTTIGILYRSTGWTNFVNNSGYMVAFNTQTGFLSVSASSTIAGVTETVVAGTTYHLKIIVTGARHRVYWNNAVTPTIDVIDTSILSAGEVGFIVNNGGVAAPTGKIDNFTITPVLSGTWQSTSLSLNALGTTGNSQIAWTEVLPSGVVGATAIVSTSLDGGTTWQQCLVNGGAIPQLPKGTNVSGKSLLVQIVLFAASSALAPQIWGLSVRVCGTYGTVSGTRISNALSLTPVGRVGSSIAFWNANLPANTGLSVAVSQDNITYTDISTSNGQPLPYWYAQPDPMIDTFSVDSHANFLSTSKAGGGAATVTYDTTNSRMTMSGGSGALYLLTQPQYQPRAFGGSTLVGPNLTFEQVSRSDVDLLCDMDESDAGGLVWRMVDTNNYYELGAYDDSSSGGFTNQLRLYKVAAGTRSLLGSASVITWNRNTTGVSPYHRIRVTMMGAVITVYFDGAAVQTYTDGSPLGAGKMGLRNDGGTSRYYQLRLQPLGDSVVGQNLYTKVTLTTSDPSVIPQLFTLVACVRGVGIATGAQIPQLHLSTRPFAAFIAKEMDSLVQASGDFYWLIDMNSVMWFQKRLASPAPFPLASQDLLYVPNVSPTSGADLFRNMEQVQNVTKLIVPPAPQQFIADGTATSWQLSYPAYNVSGITVAASATATPIAKTVGVQGINTGYDLYWQPNSTSISQDANAAKIPAGSIISVTYVGQTYEVLPLSSASSIAAQAALEGNSGIVESIDDAQRVLTTGMTEATATTFGNGLLARLGKNNAVEFVGTTARSGLLPGQMLPVFCPEHLLNNRQLPIVKVSTQGWTKADGNMYYQYTVDATDGPNLSNWAQVFF